MRTILLGLFTLAVCLPLSAQEEDGTRSLLPPKALLAKALGDKAGFVARGKVSIVKAGGGGMMAMAMGGMGSPPYQGAVEVQRLGESLIVASPREMDGFGLYIRDGVAYISRIGVVGESRSLADLSSELPRLLDPKQILGPIADARWTSTAREGGGRTLTAKLGAAVVGLRAAAGPMAAMKGKTLHVQVKLTVSKADVLEQVEFAVVRNNPMAAMAKKGMLQGLPPGMKVPDAAAEAERAVYRIDFTASKPSARIKALRTRFATLLADEDED